MTFVVTDPCIRCLHTDCVDVCPVEAFHAGANMLAINATTCIGCAACEPACPEDAIFPIHLVEGSDAEFWIDVNALVTGDQPIERLDPTGWPTGVRRAILFAADTSETGVFEPWPVIDRMRPDSHPDAVAAREESPEQRTASFDPDLADAD